MTNRCLLLALACCAWTLPLVVAEQPDQAVWKYEPNLLRPFWQGETIEGESVLFIRDDATGEARASVLFPIAEVLAVRDSAGTMTYEAGRDYAWRPGSREIVLPAGSRIVSSTPAELRRPANSQKYQLTHRDGNGEIFFGAELEYHALQTCITYRHPAGAWSGPRPRFDPAALPKSIGRLRAQQPLSIVLLGDSISTGCNASGWANGAPFQPAYPDLLRQHLAASYHSDVTLTNLSVGGTSTPWGLTMVEAVVERQPNLVILAFGMNDSAGRPAAEYQANTRAIIEQVRAKLPETELILVASMLGNRDWIRLQHDLFPQYRDALVSLAGPGIAVADLTGMWTELLKWKRDWDLTGNGVNHPNDFGHRIYAQVLSTLLVPDSL